MNDLKNESSKFYYSTYRHRLFLLLGHPAEVRLRSQLVVNAHQHALRIVAVHLVHVRVPYVLLVGRVYLLHLLAAWGYEVHVEESRARRHLLALIHLSLPGRHLVLETEVGTGHFGTPQQYDFIRLD